MLEDRPVVEKRNLEDPLIGIRRRKVLEMEATVAIAAMGFIATLGGAWLTGNAQRQAARDERLLDAKVRTFGECSASLYEYQRATFNRVKARIGDLPDEHRQPLRQEAYRANTRSRSAIGQVAILSGDEELQRRLERARTSVGDLNDATDERDLRRRSKEVHEILIHALELARIDLMKRHRNNRWSWSRVRS